MLLPVMSSLATVTAQGSAVPRPDSLASSFFGSSVKAGHVLPPVSAGVGVWLDGVGQAGMYGTVEQMNGRTRLQRCRDLLLEVYIVILVLW